MEILSLQFLYALGAIILIDLVLAGDNAIVIALAARKLPAHLQKKAIMWGTVGAIAVRTLMTVAVVWLLKVPGLMLAGGALLLWIAVKLLMPSNDDPHSGEAHASTTLVGALKTIVIADTVMGLDNVLAVAGAANGSFLLVTLGLLISIPIVVWGSTLILKWVERFPVIVYLGAGVLALTAAKMMLSEPLIQDWIAPYKAWSWLPISAVIAAVIGLGYSLNRRASAQISVATPLPVVSPSLNALVNKETSIMDQAIISNFAQTILIPVEAGQRTLAATRRLIQKYGNGGASTSPIKVHLLHITPRFNKRVRKNLPAGARSKSNWLCCTTITKGRSGCCPRHTAASAAVLPFT